MSYLSNKIGILKDVFMGNLMKLKVLYAIRIRKSITLSPLQDTTIILSMTSYGKRVKRSAPYAIYSLLVQSIRAERVVLWLDEKEFNNQNLPQDLRFLCNYGLEVHFDKDLRSYTKIIHSLKTFPDKHLITTDDDVYYTKDFVREFAKAHQEHPKDIISGYAKNPILDSNHHLKAYYDWPEYHHVTANFQYNSHKLFPLGWAGVLYPSRVFDHEVANDEIFMTLCPKADDIWLYIMGLRCHAEKRMLTNSHIAYYLTDLMRQYFTKDRLANTNRLEGENDTQLQALLAHYEIKMES